MKKARTTRDSSRGTRIAMLERSLAQLWSQLTAVQTRVGTLEVAHKAQQETRARQPAALAGPAKPAPASTAAGECGLREAATDEGEDLDVRRVWYV